MMNLDPEHERINQAFVFPTSSPASLTMEQAIEGWRQQPPHQHIFKTSPALSHADIKQIEKKYKLNLPKCYESWLGYSNGLHFAWRKNIPFVFSVEQFIQEREDWKQEVATIAETMQEDYGRDWVYPLFPELKDAEEMKLRKFVPIGRDWNNDLYLLYPQANKEEALFVYSNDSYEIKLKNSSLAHYIWFLNLYGHTHPQEIDKRLLPLVEKNIQFKP